MSWPSMGAVHRMPNCSNIMVRGSTNCFIDSFMLRPKFASAVPRAPLLSSFSCTESRVWRYWVEARMLPRCFMSAPTLRDMDISLSLRMITMGVCAWPIWLSASNAMPPESAASPMRATTLSVPPERSRAFARPNATDSESDA